MDGNYDVTALIFFEIPKKNMRPDGYVLIFFLHIIQVLDHIVNDLRNLLVFSEQLRSALLPLSLRLPFHFLA